MEDIFQESSKAFAIYARLSDMKALPVQLDGQIAGARAYGEAIGLRLNFRCIFIDTGSAVAKQRPALEALVRLAKAPARPFSTIVVNGYDRLHRDAVSLARFVQSLDKLGVSVVSADETANRWLVTADGIVAGSFGANVEALASSFGVGTGKMGRK